MPSITRSKAKVDKFSLVSAEVILKIFAPIPVRQHSCLRAVSRFHRELVMSEQYHDTRKTLGCTEDALVLLGGRDRASEVSNTEVWAILGDESDEWVRCPGLPYLPCFRSWDFQCPDKVPPVTTSLSITSCQNGLFTLGGEEFGGLCGSSHVKRFNLSDQSDSAWSCMCPLPQGENMDMWSNLIDETLIAGGGATSMYGLPVNNEVFSLDISNPWAQWKELPSMPHGVSDAASFVHGRKIYVIGGYGAPEKWTEPDDDDYDDTERVLLPFVQCFDFDVNSWHVKCQMPPDIISSVGLLPSASYFEKGLFHYVISGEGAVNLISYNPDDDSWSEAPILDTSDCDSDIEESLCHFTSSRAVPFRGGVAVLGRGTGEHGSHPHVIFIDLKAKTAVSLLTDDAWYSFSPFSQCSGWQDQKDRRFTLLCGAHLTSFELRWRPALAQMIENQRPGATFHHKFCIKGLCRFDC